MEKRASSGKKAWGGGFSGVVGHSVSSTASLHSRRGGLIPQSQAARPLARLPAPPQFFADVPLKSSLFQQHPPFSAGGGDSTSSLKDEKIRELEGRVKFLENQISSGSLSKQLSNMSEELGEARSALKRKEETLQTVYQEHESLKSVFLELREEFRLTQERLELLQENENNRAPKTAKKGKQSASKTKEKENHAAKAAAATKAMLEGKISALEKDILSYQNDFLGSCLRPSTSASKTSQGTNGLTKTPTTTDLHSFLRQTIQKLRDDVNSLCGERQALQSQLEGKNIECLRLESELKALQEDAKRLGLSVKRLKEQTETLQGERDSLRSSFQEAIVPELEMQVESLKMSNESLERKLEEREKESIGEQKRLEQEVIFERDKADMLLAQSIEEREGAEGRWRERWEEHTARMKDEMIALRKEYEEPLRTAHVREERLRLALAEVEERYERSKGAWETYRRDLFDQVSEWKGRFSQKVELLETLREGKIEMEVLLQKKLEEVTVCHEMVRRGVEERQELERRLEDLEERLKRSHEDTSHYHNLHEQRPGVTEDDFAELQAKMIQDAAIVASATPHLVLTMPPISTPPNPTTATSLIPFKQTSKSKSRLSSSLSNKPETLPTFTVGGSSNSPSAGGVRRKSPTLSIKGSSRSKVLRKLPH